MARIQLPLRSRTSSRIIRTNQIRSAQAPDLLSGLSFETGSRLPDPFAHCGNSRVGWHRSVGDHPQARSNNRKRGKDVGFWVRTFAGLTADQLGT